MADYLPEVYKHFQRRFAPVKEAFDALGAAEHELYERRCNEAAADLAATVRPGDVVLLHDPQTAGMVPRLAGLGMAVGLDHRGETLAQLVHEGVQLLVGGAARDERHRTARESGTFHCQGTRP